MVSRTSQGCKRKQMVFELNTLTWIYLDLIHKPSREIGTINVYLWMGRAHGGDIKQPDQSPCGEVKELGLEPKSVRGQSLRSFRWAGKLFRSEMIQPVKSSCSYRQAPGSVPGT